MTDSGVGKRRKRQLCTDHHAKLTNLYSENWRNDSVGVDFLYR